MLKMKSTRQKDVTSDTSFSPLHPHGRQQILYLFVAFRHNGAKSLFTPPPLLCMNEGTYHFSWWKKKKGTVAEAEEDKRSVAEEMRRGRQGDGGENGGSSIHRRCLNYLLPLTAWPWLRPQQSRAAGSCEAEHHLSIARVFTLSQLWGITPIKSPKTGKRGKVLSQQGHLAATLSRRVGDKPRYCAVWQ